MTPGYSCLIVLSIPILVCVTIWMFKTSIAPILDTTKPAVLKTNILAITILLFVFVPLEELLFRSWLILYFQSMISETWVWLTISSFIFGLMHIRNGIATATRMTPKNNGPDETDEQYALRYQENRDFEYRCILFGTIAFTTTFSLGMILGYIGIKFQSLLIPFAIHLGYDFLLMGINIIYHHLKKELPVCA